MSSSGDAASVSAKDFIVQLAEKYGFFHDDLLASFGELDQAGSERMQNSLSSLQRLASVSIKTLAQNLYSSNARFIFELLQNADDNKYGKASAKGEEPYISFQLFSNKMVIECNEDGFTQENVQAICSVGESTKLKSHGYVGEKGIGFKSVFMVAEKVHIQSNDFSFVFNHKRGEPGFGMVTPHWEDVDESLPTPMTRFTLYLHECEDSEDARKERDLIRRQLDDLQSTVLLFLRNLRGIQVTIHDDEDKIASQTTFSIDRGEITTTSKISLDGSVVQNRYLIVKHDANSLPAHEQRDKSQASGAFDKSEVVLAFPLTEDLTPLVENQFVFAFLPVRPLGFKFIIQADFVTQANREDININSPRNHALRGAIAEAFVKAADLFCEHPTLQHTWIRWLPQLDAYPWDSFWQHLLGPRGLIQEQMRGWPLIKSRATGKLYPISSLRSLPEYVKDANQDPLFEDLEAELYVAKEYQDEDLKLVEPYGLESIGGYAIMDRVESDLAKPPDQSRFKSAESDSDWQHRALKLMVQLFQQADEQGNVGWRSRLLNLTLLPSKDGTWKAPIPGPFATPSPLYFPHVDGIPIPGDLGLNLLDENVLKGPDAEEVFRLFQVKKATADEIRELAFTKPFQTLEASIARLRFLYLTDSPTALTPANAWTDFTVYTQNMSLMRPRRSYMFVKNDDPYGPYKLLENMPFTVPGRNVTFINEAYFENGPETPAGANLPWNSWVLQKLDIEQKVPLLSVGVGVGAVPMVSTYMRFLSSDRKERFLGALKRAWPGDGTDFPRLEHVKQVVGEFEVPCSNGTVQPLSLTWLPTPDLIEKCAKYLDVEKFPFLKLEDLEITETYRDDWGFLINHFDVGHQDDVKFYLKVLAILAKEPPKESQFLTIVDLYRVIKARCLDSTNPNEAERIVRNAFKDNAFLLLPYKSPLEPVWARHSECRWGSQPTMKTIKPLGPHYRAIPGISGVDADQVKDFVMKDLGVRNYSAEDLLGEIRDMKKRGDINEEHLTNYYGVFDSVRRDHETIGRRVKYAFQHEALIYVKTGDTGTSSWRTVEACLWSSEIEIQWKVALEDMYFHLEEYFVDFLGVPVLTPLIVMNELKRTGGEKKPIPEVKKALTVLNSLLHDTETKPDPSEFTKSSVFPVRSAGGDVSLLSDHSSFLINDRKPLGDALRDKASFLDFTFEEVRELRELISWGKLESRYLSSSVKETTAIGTDERIRVWRSDRQIADRAYALTRIAADFNSPRTEKDNSSLHQMLRKAEVYETDHILSELEVQENGEPIKHQLSQGLIHIQEEGVFQIFLAKDPKSQQQAFYEKLPRLLHDRIMKHPDWEDDPPDVYERGLRIFTTVLLVPLEVVPTILDSEGIMEIESVEELEKASAYEGPSASTTTTNVAEAEVEAEAAPSTTDQNNTRVVTRNPREYSGL